MVKMLDVVFVRVDFNEVRIPNYNIFFVYFSGLLYFKCKTLKLLLN